MSYIYKYTHEDENGNERKLELHYTYTPGLAARVYGPPENCCPAEPAEVEILAVVDPKTGNEITNEELNIDWDDLIEAIIETHELDYGCDDDYDDPDTDYGDEY